MNTYHKINSVYKRDNTKKKAPFIIGDYSTPEIEYLKDNQWEWTEKIDGTNIRVMLKDGETVIAGKSDKSDVPKHLMEKLQILFRNDKLLKAFGGDVCLYGEGFGFKIQGDVGKEYLGDDVDFYLFDVKVGNLWLARSDVDNVADILDIRPPIVIGYGTIDQAIDLVKKGFKSHIGTADAEGLVLRPAVEMFDRLGQRIITKIKTRDFN